MVSYEYKTALTRDPACSFISSSFYQVIFVWTYNAPEITIWYCFWTPCFHDINLLDMVWWLDNAHSPLVCVRIKLWPSFSFMWYLSINILILNICICILSCSFIHDPSEHIYIAYTSKICNLKKKIKLPWCLESVFNPYSR